MSKDNITVIETDSDTYSNPNYYSKIIPDPVKIDKVIIKELLQSNDIYEKYRCTTEITGELIICKNNKLNTTFENKIIQETYEEYIEEKKSRNMLKDQWIYNIVDGHSEQSDIIYQDDYFILLPNYTWNTIHIDKLHLLGIVKDKSIQTLRDLNNSNIELLQHIKLKSLQQIKEMYNIDKEYLKIYIHYVPSVYLLHIHFVNTNFIEVNSSFEYSHSLDTVIFNLDLYSDYYKKIKLIRRI
jgi:hypothetical protein